MFEYRLSVLPPPNTSTPEVGTTFYWHSLHSTPYFHSNVGPQLGEYGPVNNRNVDLVRIATAVLAADRSASRSGRLSQWNQRDIALTIDVLAVTPWNRVKADLERLLGFLTGDAWALTFHREQGAPEQLGRVGIDAQRVVLLSGGADSAAGALLSARELAARGEQQTLVSHWSSTNLSPVQTRLAADIERRVPGSTADHIKAHLARGRHAPDGVAYGREDSTRSRSLLFIALGLAIASVNRVPLWLPENGYASVNPPLSKSRRGSLSTKTTHPKFLADLRSILDRVGGHADLVNPFASMTKGAMFKRVRDDLGETEASKYLSQTTSCSHTGARSYGISPDIACGVCFGCLLRRASFIAAGLPDDTKYLKPVDARQRRWLEEKSAALAMRDFLAAPFNEMDLVGLQIPSELSLADVDDLIQRGRDELRGLGL